MTVEKVIDYGPLRALSGCWVGDKGKDVSPEPDGVEDNLYRERLEFEPIADVTNAEEQDLAAVHYTLKVWRMTNEKLIHHQTGYWLWCAADNTIMHSFTIPRGLTVLASGSAQYVDGDVIIDVASRLDDDNYTVSQSPFMQAKASCLAFTQTMKICGDSLSYHQTTLLDIYGKTFSHTDTNALTKVR